MIADASGAMDALKFDADQQFFRASLDAAAAVAHGRHSAEGGPRVERRRRLILTRRIAALTRDPQNSKALLWNPSGASFEDAWRALGAPDGALAVIGGTCVFGLFLEIGYDAFHLSRARNVFPVDGLYSQSSSVKSPPRKCLQGMASSQAPSKSLTRSPE
jgi:dihydrofolate reductase